MVAPPSQRDPLAPRPGTYPGFERADVDDVNCGLCRSRFSGTGWRVVTYLNHAVILSSQLYVCDDCHAHLSSKTQPAGTTPLRSPDFDD